MKKTIILMLLMVVAFSAVIVSAADVTITKIDGQTPVGGVVDISSATPTFEGTSTAPGTVISVYDRTVGGVPSINKVAGESGLSLTYIPYDPNNVFYDNFDSLNTQIWSVIGLPPEGSIIGENGQLKIISGSNSYTSGESYRGATTSVDKWQYFTLQDLNTVEADFIAPSWINSTASRKYGVSLAIQSSSGPMSIIISSPGNTGSQASFFNSCSGCSSPSALVDLIPGNTYRLKIEYDKNAGTVKSYLDGVLKVQDNNIFGFASTGFIGVSLYADTPNIGDSVYFDNVSTNFVYPAGYLMARTGMELNGVSYMDSVPDLGIDPGVVVWGGDGPMQLPRVLDELGADIYVYLTTLDLTAFGGGIVHWTIYSGPPDVAAPNISFKQVVEALNSGAMGFIIPTTVNAFAKTFTYSGNNIYVSENLPLTSQGQIVYNTGTGQAEILPPAGVPQETLLAKATADNNGNWIAYFGKDEFGSNIPGLTDLLGLHESPYTFIAKDSSGGESNTVFANLVSGPPSITQMCYAATDCTITFGGITLHIAPGALSADTSITIEEDQTLPVEFELSTNQGVALASKVFAYNIIPDSATLSGTGSYIKFDWSGQNVPNEENLKIIKNGVPLTDKCVNDPGCDAAANTFQFGINSFSQWIFATVPDTDGDGVTDELDQCKYAQGQAAYNGCPSAIKVSAVRHTIEGTTKNPSSVKYPLPGLIVKLFDKSDGSCAASYGISWQNYPSIDENCGSVALCITNANGECIVGALPGDYMVIGRHISIDGNGQTITIDDKHLGVSASDLAAGQLMQKHLQLLEVPDLNSGGSKKLPASTKKITGSFLEITQPDYVIWSGTEELYPFIFTSDADWTVDVCLYVPEGYRPVDQCLQTFVTGETKVLQFRVVEVGSVPGDTDITFDLSHKDSKGKVIKQKVTSKIGSKMTKELEKVKTGKAKGKSQITGAATYRSGEPMRSLVIVATAGIAVIAALVLLMLHKKN